MDSMEERSWDFLCEIMDKYMQSSLSGYNCRLVVGVIILPWDTEKGQNPRGPQKIQYSNSFLTMQL